MSGLGAQGGAQPLVPGGARGGPGQQLCGKTQHVVEVPAALVFLGQGEAVNNADLMNIR
jgi:hypothetical protein